MAVYSSDLQRAVRTAELAGFPSPTVTPLLREYDYGSYEGLTSAQIWERRPGWELFRDGCPDGEQPEQIYERARSFISLLQDLEGAVLAFAHGHITRTLAVAWTELPVTAAARLALDTAALSVVIENDRGRQIKRWNRVP